LAEEYKTNLLKRIITSIVIILPIVLILLSANIWAFSVLITVICLLAMFEWFKSKLQKPIIGVLLILNFYFWSILLVISPGMYEEGVYVWYGILILNTAIFDSFAYLIGSKFGKTYIAKKISPNKTLEGLIGGILGSMLFGIFVGYQIQDYGIILFFIFLCFLAFVGDLLISFIKRQSGVKDTGTILPGHGGILDRLDSHLIVIPVSIMITVL
tara:strand:+ start:533 stop:1171 length:639 start_codon:yes stop_codon:yes gene_type:complete